jgi:hypothetical protein
MSKKSKKKSVAYELEYIARSEEKERKRVKKRNLLLCRPLWLLRS